MLPLCVDLDETLILNDLFMSGLKRLAQTKPWLLPHLFFASLKGRPNAKVWLTRHLPLDVAQLPFRTALLAYLQAQKKKDRKLYLVSASNEEWVKQIAAHLALFDGAYGSSSTHNLKGSNKAAFIQEHIAADFVYAGDSFADCAVWAKASGAILCGKACMFKDSLKIPVEAIFPNSTGH